MATRSCVPYIVVLLVLCLGVFGDSDPESDRAALLALRSAVGGRLLLWTTNATTPCSWQGVNCSHSRVVELRLPGMGLSGHLPSGVIGNLSELHTLSLRYNSLSGSLPFDLASLPNLRNLYLQNNLFSGQIPGFLFTMQNLVRLNIAANKFTGEISPNFSNLSRLATLYLEQNQLNGTIPDLNLKLDQFNVSSNRLGGSIPSKFSGFPSSSFAGNSLCGKPLISCNGTATDGERKKKKKLSGRAIAGIVIGSAIGVLLILLLLICLCLRKKRNKRDTKQSGKTPAGGAQGIKGVGNKELVFFRKVGRGFDLEDLLRASAEVLGKGTFGTAYKVTLEDRMVMAVKRLKDVTVSEKEFREKIEAVGMMSHENLVPLRAYYFSSDEKLLVCDYMPMGSLSALLHGNTGAGRTPLNWETRSGIALGAARGIAYIHSQGLPNSHGNIKSSNILLTTSYEARVSDFGLAHLAGLTAFPNRVAGYRAPEVTDARKVSQKADVYSLGVLLLEILTGKAPTTHAVLNDDGVDLPRWVQSIVREEWSSEVFDPELLRYHNVEEEMVRLLQLAVDCTAHNPDNRPSMEDVARRIEEICRSSMRRDEDTDDDTSL